MDREHTEEFLSDVIEAVAVPGYQSMLISTGMNPMAFMAACERMGEGSDPALLAEAVSIGLEVGNRLGPEIIVRRGRRPGVGHPAEFLEGALSIQNISDDDFICEVAQIADCLPHFIEAILERKTVYSDHVAAAVASWFASKDGRDPDPEVWKELRDDYVMAEVRRRPIPHSRGTE